MKHSCFGFPRALCHLVGAAALLMLCGAPAMAQNPAVRYMTAIYPYAPGAPADGVLRMMATEAAKTFGHPVVVENRPGGNGRLGAQAMLQNRGQGNIVTMATNGTLVNDPMRDPNFSFQAGKDYTPILGAFLGPYLLVVNAALPVRDIASLVAYAKANRGKVNWGTGSPGNVAHLSMISVNDKFGTDFTAIHYKGEPPIWPALITGEVHVALLSTTIKPHIDSGKMVPLAITTKQRMPLYPNVPTAGEVGLPFLTYAGFWMGMIAPPDLTPDIVTRLNRTFGDTLRSPDIAKKVGELGFENLAGTPESFATMIRNEIEYMTPIVKRVKID